VSSPIHHLEKLSDYKRFFHTKAYIQSKSNTFENSRELMQKCGYASLRKFKFRRKLWDNLERPIPRKYLEAIGVRIETLQFTVELDDEEYERALELPFSPKKALLRNMPTMFTAFKLPEGVTEEEAIWLLKGLSRKTGKYGFINFENIKTTFAQPDGFVFTKYYKPLLRITGDMVIASADGRGVGRVTLK
jgi:hypothetical protein